MKTWTIKLLSYGVASKPTVNERDGHLLVLTPLASTTTIVYHGLCFKNGTSDKNSLKIKKYGI